MSNWKRSGLHLFNTVSFYSCPYLAAMTKEYWSGRRRQRILRVGQFTVWVGLWK